MSAYSWENRRVLITGASSGIGTAIARELAGAGAIVGICARRTAMLEAVLADCRKSVAGCRGWTMDLADLDALEGFVHRVESELGGIDVLVNNAAQALSGPAPATPWKHVEYLMRLDYLSPRSSSWPTGTAQARPTDAASGTGPEPARLQRTKG